MRRTRTFIALGLAALLAVGGSALAIASSGGSSPSKPKPAAQFRSTLASKLAAQLGKPADQVQAALTAVARQRHAATPADRAARLRRLAARLQQRAQALAKGVRPGRAGRGRGAGRGAGRKAAQAWAAALAKQLKLPVAKVDAAVRAVVAEQLDSLVKQGWITQAQRDRVLSRGPGVALLRRLAMIRG